jgi:hypothetical protein
MVQPNLSPSKPKKKKIPKKPSQKQLAREKHVKRLDEFKVVPLVKLQLIFKSRVEEPQLNTIGTPSSIQKVKGKKKGKKFVKDDTVFCFFGF